MADEKYTLQLDLDDADFVAKALSAKKNMASLGDKDNLKGLLEGLAEGNQKLGELGDAADGGLGNLVSIASRAGPVLAGIAVAAASIKAAFDLTLEAESVIAVNAQFEILTRQAGISGAALAEGLKASANGLIEETDLLKLANKAIVEMGASASRLPELLEIARKSAIVMGTSATDAFNSLQSAIAMGNQRMLKHAGIILDINKVYRDFAAANNTTAAALSEAGKQQALMNAVLEKGQKDLSGIDPDIKQATNTWIQFKVTMQAVMEAIALAFNSVAGDAVKYWLGQLKEAAEATKNFFVANFGAPVDQARLKVQQFGGELNRLASLIVENQNKLEEGRKNGFHWWDNDEKGYEHTIERLKAQYDQLRAQQKQEQDLLKQDAAKQASANKSGGSAGAPIIDKTAQAKEEAKFQQEMQRLEKETYDLRVKLVNSTTQIEALGREQRLMEETKYQNEIKAIETSETLSRSQKQQLEEQAYINHQLRMRQIDQQTEEDRIKLLQQYQKNSTTTFQGISRAAQATAAEQTRWLTNAGIQGKFVFDKLSDAGVNAFDALGRGAATGSNELAASLLKSLADICSSYGKAMMLASLWPFNPAVFAAGAALVVLGGFVSAKAGGGGAAGGGDVGSVSAGSSGGSGSSLGTTAFPSAAAPVSMASSTGPKHVTIAIEGNYFDTESTRMRLVELVRASADATDFDLRKIGQ
jgi:hypothetical protein